MRCLPVLLSMIELFGILLLLEGGKFSKNGSSMKIDYATSWNHCFRILFFALSLRLFIIITIDDSII